MGVPLSYSIVVSKRGVGVFSAMIEEAEEIQFQMILQNRNANPKASRVVIMALHLIVSEAFLKSIPIQHLLRVLFLAKPYVKAN